MLATTSNLSESSPSATPLGTTTHKDHQVAALVITLHHGFLCHEFYTNHSHTQPAYNSIIVEYEISQVFQLILQAQSTNMVRTYLDLLFNPNLLNINFDWNRTPISKYSCKPFFTPQKPNSNFSPTLYQSPQILWFAELDSKSKTLIL